MDGNQHNSNMNTLKASLVKKVIKPDKMASFHINRAKDLTLKHILRNLKWIVFFFFGLQFLASK
jgi:hypothetical protein